MSIKTTFPRMSLNNAYEYASYIQNFQGYPYILGIYILENKCPRSQLNDFWDVFTFLCIQNELIDN